jgi:phosphopantetheine adenylyltransferase
MNWELGGVETLYMASNDKYRSISSTLVREIVQFGAARHRLHAFIPEEIEEIVFDRLKLK